MEKSEFPLLNWRRFYGPIHELIALRNGFFDARNRLRRENHQFTFLFGEKESFTISGKEGFNQFASRVFLGNEEKASFAAIALLNEVQLQALNWHQILHLRMQNDQLAADQLAEIEQLRILMQERDKQIQERTEERDKQMQSNLAKLADSKRVSESL